MKNILLVFIFIGSIFNSINFEKKQIIPNEIIKLVSKNKKIKFPFFEYKNKTVSDKINQTLRDSLKDKLDEPFEKDDIKTIIENVSKILDVCSYEVFYSKNTVSIVFIFESSSGAYPTSWSEYYNFSKLTGKLLSTKDIFSDKRDFLKRFKSKEKIYIKNYIKELTQTDADTSNVKIAIREINDGCFKYFDDRFKIQKDVFYFYPNYCVPHFMQNIAPYEPIVFSKMELKNILKKEYQ